MATLQTRIVTIALIICSFAGLNALGEDSNGHNNVDLSNTGVFRIINLMNKKRALESENKVIPSTTFTVPVEQRQLFLDDFGIAELKNLTRTLHQPTKKGAVIQPEDSEPEITAVQIRTAPMWDPQQNVYKLWDLNRPKGMHACGRYYESKDGIHWAKPSVGQIEYRGTKENNLVSVVSNGVHGGLNCVVYDRLDPDSAHRFKGLAVGFGSSLQPVVSSDGITWRKLNVPPLPPHLDEYNMSFDEIGHLFIVTLKNGGPYGRAVFLSTSKDFQAWTKPKLIFHADDLDQKLGRVHIEHRFTDSTLQQPAYNVPSTYNVDVYNMGVFRYESLYIGMPSMFHQTGKVARDWPGFVDGFTTPEMLTNYRRDGDWSGFHHVQLTSSRDLRNWQRLGGRQPFLDLSPVGTGAYDTGCIIGPSSPVVRGDELWFYYTGLKVYGGPELDWKNGAICLAVLRRDGFISLDATEKEGTILTKPFMVTGSKLYANVNALNGELRVKVLDTTGKVLATSSLLKGNLPRGELLWQQGNISALKGQTVSFQFTLRNASFYAYWLGD